MVVNRGKQFESVVRDAFLRVPGVSVDRLHDQMTGYKGSQNICDFIVYKKPYEYYVECKSVGRGNVLPFSMITTAQWRGLDEKSDIVGVYAGILCWFVERNATLFYPIRYLHWLAETGAKSVRYDNAVGIPIDGRKKRVFFDYDMNTFFERVSG